MTKVGHAVKHGLNCTSLEKQICKNMEPIVNIHVQHFYHKPLARVTRLTKNPCKTALFSCAEPIKIEFDSREDRMSNQTSILTTSGPSAR